MKTFAYLILFIFVLQPYYLSATLKQCECGSHSTGIVAYTEDGETCCDSMTVGSGMIYSYQYNQGVWEYVDTSYITGSSAQNKCCKNS